MNEAPDDSSPLQQPPAKRSSMMIIVMIINLVLVGGVLAFLFLRDQPKDSTAEQPDTQPNVAAGPAVRQPGPLIPLDDFVVNLADREVSRYLKVGLSLEIASEEVSEKVKSLEPLIRDAVITLTSSLTFQDIRTSKGKQALREQITKRLGELLGANHVANVYFTEFVVQ